MQGRIHEAKEALSRLTSSILTFLEAIMDSWLKRCAVRDRGGVIPARILSSVRDPDREVKDLNPECLRFLDWVVLLYWETLSRVNCSGSKQSLSSRFMPITLLSP